MRDKSEATEVALDAQTDIVHWGSTELSYVYRFRVGRRSLSITIHPDLRIEVMAPAGTALDTIRAKVLKRARWISKARRGFEQFHPLQPPRTYVPGEAHRYLGRQCRLKVVEGGTPSVKLTGGLLVVTVSRMWTQKVIRTMVEAWILERAKEIFRERLYACHLVAHRYKIPYPDLWIRRMNTRWGSRTPAGRIILNPELIKAPRGCIDYVIMHELCHLIEPNHNARFWQLLGALMPDWEERRGRLNIMADI